MSPNDLILWSNFDVKKIPPNFHIKKTVFGDIRPFDSPVRNANLKKKIRGFGITWFLIFKDLSLQGLVAE